MASVTSLTPITIEDYETNIIIDNLSKPSNFEFLVKYLNIDYYLHSESYSDCSWYNDISSESYSYYNLHNDI